MDAYFELDTERNHAMGIERIPFSKILAYGEYVGLIDAALDDFTVIMRITDNEMIRYRQQQEKTK